MNTRTMLLGLVLAAPVLVAESQVELLRTGSFHGDEISSNSAGSWLALVLDSNGASLHSVRASVTLEEDLLVDGKGETTGKNVSIAPPLEPIALLRGSSTLAPGRVPTALTGEAIEPGQPVSVRIGRATWSLSVSCAETQAVSGQRQQECHLSVRNGHSEERVFTYLAYTENGEMLWASEYPPTVIWAGDIDGDNRLDLLLDTSNHYNVDAMTLYLSSAAGAGQLLGEAGTFHSVGC